MGKIYLPKRLNIPKLEIGKPEMPKGFRASPTKVVKFVNEKGEVVREVALNRAQRRRMGVR